MSPRSFQSPLPSKRLLGLFLLPAALSMWLVLGPLGAFRGPALWAVLTLDVVLVAAALADLWLSRGARVEVTGDCADVLSLGRATRVDLWVTSQGDRSTTVQLQLDLSANLTAEPATTSLRVTATSGSSVAIQVTPHARGQHSVFPVHSRQSSRLGLWLLQARHGAARGVRVYPDLGPIRSYELLLRKHRQNALVRASRQRGGESEFARLRDYTTDDDYRFIDWKATARRGKLTSREYQLESDQNIMLVLDAGRLMTAEVAGISYFDQALSASLLLSHVACRGGDRVGLLCFDEEIRCLLLPQGGPKTTSRLVQAAYNIHPRLTDSSYTKALSVFDSKVKQRALLVLFTQLIDDHSAEELANHVRHLARKHLVLVVILEDSDLRAMALAPRGTGTRPTTKEVYQRGAAAELLNWRAKALATLRDSGAQLIEVTAQELSSRVLNRYLRLKAHRAL